MPSVQEVVLRQILVRDGTVKVCADTADDAARAALEHAKKGRVVTWRDPEVLSSRVTYLTLIEHSVESSTLLDDSEPVTEHPDHPVADWQYEVANGDTRLGYQDWVAAKIEAKEG